MRQPYTIIHLHDVYIVNHIHTIMVQNTNRPQEKLPIIMMNTPMVGTKLQQLSIGHCKNVIAWPQLFKRLGNHGIVLTLLEHGNGMRNPNMTTQSKLDNMGM